MNDSHTTPTVADSDALAHMWASIANRVREQYGITSSLSPEYLTWVQQLLDDNAIDGLENPYESIGCAFGVILAEHLEGFDWWAASSDLGRSLCLRYRDTHLCVHVLRMVARRVEANEEVDLPVLFQATKCRVRELALEAGRVS
jgi:hypothetical protein